MGLRLSDGESVIGDGIDSFDKPTDCRKRQRFDKEGSALKRHCSEGIVV